MKEAYVDLMKAAYVDLIKAGGGGRVKQHYAKTKSGKMALVKEHFRHVYRAARSMGDDDEMTTRSRSSVAKRIPPKWHSAIKTTNAVLAELKGKSVRDVIGSAGMERIKKIWLKGGAEGKYFDAEGKHLDEEQVLKRLSEDTAIEALLGGEDTEQKAIIRALGPKGKIVDKVIHHIWDGDLHDHFYSGYEDSDED